MDKEKPKYPKEEIVTYRLQGGLKEGEQVCKVNYMPEYEDYCDKLELYAGVEKDGKPIEKYRSIRFVHPKQVKGLIMGLTKGYVKFAKKRNIITPLTFKGEFVEFMKQIENILRGNGQ